MIALLIRMMVSRMVTGILRIKYESHPFIWGGISLSLTSGCVSVSNESVYIALNDGTIIDLTEAVTMGKPVWSKSVIDTTSNFNQRTINIEVPDNLDYVEILGAANNYDAYEYKFLIVKNMTAAYMINNSYLCKFEWQSNNIACTTESRLCLTLVGYQY